MAYPVEVAFTPQLEGRNRLTSAFRPLLAIPHMILVGPAIRLSASESAPGLLTSVAYFLGIVSWFTILFGDRHLQGIRDLSLYYLRWRTRALAYMTLLVDTYPPFGDEPYPATISVMAPVEPRDRLSVALRVVLALPHLLVLALLLAVLLLLTIVAWVFVILTGRYPAALYPLVSGTIRWALRVEAYMLLLVDEYPPFSLE